MTNCGLFLLGVLEFRALIQDYWAHSTPLGPAYQRELLNLIYKNVHIKINKTIILPIATWV
jgi:hypothetical protein